MRPTEILTMLRERQIAHITEHQLAFDEHQCTKNADVKQYFNDYWQISHPDDLYICLCNDLGIKRRQSALEQNLAGKG